MITWKRNVIFIFSYTEKISNIFSDRQTLLVAVTVANRVFYRLNLSILGRGNATFSIFDKHAQANGRIKNLVHRWMHLRRSPRNLGRQQRRLVHHFREGSSACDSIRDPTLLSNSTSVLTFFWHILTHHSSSPRISNSRWNPAVHGVPFASFAEDETGIHQCQPLNTDTWRFLDMTNVVTLFRLLATYESNISGKDSRSHLSRFYRKSLPSREDSIVFRLG